MEKILYIVSTLKRSGPTNQLFNIIKNIDRSSFEPILLTLSPEVKDSKWQDYLSLGIEMRTLNLSRFSGLFFAKSIIEKLINEIQPALIHTQGIRADQLSSKLISTIPKVATVRNFPQKDFLMTYGDFIGHQMVRSQIRAFKKLSVCVGVSEAVSDNLKNTFNLNHVETIKNGVDTEIYMSVDELAKKRLRKKLGLPFDSKIWLVSGHLNERKDPLFLINTWKYFFSNNTKHCLVLIGDGDLQDKCSEFQGCQQNIKVVGRVVNVVDYLQASDYYLAASKAEGMPNAALEALACGLPLLLSDIGPHNELIKMDEKIGLTYEIGNPDDFFEKIKKLIDHEHHIMRSACLNLISKSLSASVMSQKYQSLYIKLISKV